ncbi:MAG TPA: kelch repeat-containing protein [Candidatus Dormibacteraeota bacterium]|nr:kelch repeat-containing protein [Candidatus Dormibacteraeota bacterium]
MIAACGGSTTANKPPPSPENPTFTPYAQPSPQPAQKTEASLPVPIEEAAAAATGGKLYVMGGFNAAGVSLNSTYVFDGSSWQSGPSLPLGLDHPSATTFAGQVYIAGGHSNGLDSARLFRLDGDHWTELAPMRYARGGHALIAFQGKLYAVGGNNSRINVPQVEAYDPTNNTWSVVTSLPDPRNHLMGFVLKSGLCVAGGRSPTTARVDCFNSSWSSMPALPAATSGGGAAAFAGGDVVVTGGQDASETRIVDQLERWDGHAWTGEAMLSPRHGFELAIYEGRAWACGGGSAPGLHPVAICTSIGDPAALARGR